MALHRRRIDALADVVAKYPDTWIITDDIYNRMVFDGIGYRNFVQSRPELRDRVIFIDSLSKTYGMPGWRVGFMAGPGGGLGGHHDELNHITNIPRSSPPRRSLRWTVRRTCRPKVRRVPGQARPGDGGDGRHPRRRLPEAAGCVLRVPRRQLRVRQVARARSSPTTSGSATRCWKPRAWPACRARRSASRALRISFTCPTAQLAPGLARVREFFAELS